ncbi:type III restriction-modification system endonuclease [Dialister sp.]|jgi:type III restriction enzyme|uniref:type III restriction-modification system endonuclease n=1 Tax=Dialister sp. TaxID=1955814 RepID=UPI003A5BE1D0
MDLILEQGLPHQEKAVKAVCDVFKDVYIKKPSASYRNPVVDLTDATLVRNIHDIEAVNIRPEDRRNHPIGDCLTIDVKMETGTGKTYVYTKLMYELHRLYGFNKFIIIVPTLAIKAGTSQFLQDPYARRHFKEDCGYDTDLDALILSAQKKKKGKSYFPSVVSDFIKGSAQNRKKIYTLVMNMHLLSNSAKGMLARDDYGYGAMGFYRPFDGIAATKPVVIIDEAHRFARDQKSYQIITDEIKPQCIIRFGATFPEKTEGRGKKKQTFKDYENLVYDLNACKSFNMGLIKGVAKEHFEPINKREEKLKITSIENKETVHFKYTKDKEESKFFALKKGDALSVISDDLEGITITAISRSTVVFSNGVEKSTGEEMEVSAMMPSYQDQMMKLALQRHFEIERDNFTRRKNKIKTLALFFIDDVTSYRAGKDGKKPYLLESFERLLKEAMLSMKSKLGPDEREYRDYLDASLADLSACHAGYFAIDNSSSDEAIAQEVDVILHQKKQLISFKTEDGRWNTLRFLFSKWTLKEGWDNPNVFTICKLRSSGSEISKLQEVGRGLRLPVDEYGSRISNETFYLNYIVDFTERDFAQKLVDQINADVSFTSVISDEMVRAAAEARHMDPDDLFLDLLMKKYITRKYEIVGDNREAFFMEYPEFNVGVKLDKIKDRNKVKNPPVKIRKNVYGELKDLWEKVNKNYLLLYDKDLDRGLEDRVYDILEDSNNPIFAHVTLTSDRTLVGGRITGDEGTPLKTTNETGVQYTLSREVPYGEFLVHISRLTNLPVPTLHRSFQKYVKKHPQVDKTYFNVATIEKFRDAWNMWKMNHLSGHFRYVSAQSQSKQTALTDAAGNPLETIAQGRIGTYLEEGTPSEKYLYDVMAYDSPLELSNIKSGDIEEIVVYGKIPRRSIAIPTISGGTYSPDFMYIVKKKDGKKELHLIVETKDKKESDLTDDEKVKIRCAEIFFENLSREGYKVFFHRQMKSDKMKAIIDDVLLHG